VLFGVALYKIWFASTLDSALAFGTLKQKHMGNCAHGSARGGRMKSDEPIFAYGKGRNQIVIKGDRAIREARSAIRWLLLARALSVLLRAITIVAVVFIWRFG
jgi:hypothetical protein